jgi:hypothetical protein
MAVAQNKNKKEINIEKYHFFRGSEIVKQSSKFNFYSTKCTYEIRGSLSRYDEEDYLLGCYIV